MEENNVLQFIKTKPTVSIDQLEKRFIDNISPINMDELAAKVAIKLNTQVNEELKRNSERIDKLTKGISSLIHEIKKQSVDENNSSFKVARINEKADVTIDSLDAHISFIISFAHIAECYHLYTDKDDNKYSVHKARKMLSELNLLEDTNFVSKTLNGSKTVTKKYHFKVLSEIKNRLNNPENYYISKEIAEKWRRMAFVPNDEEINTKVNEVFELLK